MSESHLLLKLDESRQIRPMKFLDSAPSGAENLFKTFSVAAAAIFMVSAAASLSVGTSSAEPATVQPGETVNNQLFEFQVSEVSADGNTDTFYVEFPNDLNDSISANQASFDNASVTSSIELVDGVDEDGVDDTFRFSTSPTGDQDYVTLNAVADVSVDYPDEEASYAVTATVEDSSGETVSSEIATVQAESGSSDSTDESSGSEDSENSSDESSDETSDDETTEESSGSSQEDESESSEDSDQSGDSDEGFFATIGSFLTGLF